MRQPRDGDEVRAIAPVETEWGGPRICEGTRKKVSGVHRHLLGPGIDDFTFEGACTDKRVKVVAIDKHERPTH